MTQHDHDGEGRRQAYLAALGIPLWSSRQPLPGAQPAEALGYVPLAAQLTAAPTAAPRPVSPAPAAEEQQAVPVPRTGEVRESRALPAEQQAAPASAGEKLPRFICRVQPLAPGWSAIVTLGEVPDLSAQEYRLLGNIAEALGGDATAAQPCEQLGWPLNRNPRLDHSAAAAVQWLAHALKLPQGRCVVFGEALAAYVRAALPQQRMTVAPALAALLQDPAAKRRLWQDLHD